ncbi:hypothetical protein BC938DRAFT_482411 [Jimgerdemannia flammicorona]|uniref:Uncharacterized protein n=1 Tax=Jimgerdemannia flammicorona TaxID=994334 RepID=A0A433QWG5_9FUNG|nr:hypothetical protein BC938DRAFT_482411 [Jimgerdemannia flammicorona]
MANVDGDVVEADADGVVEVDDVEFLTGKLNREVRNAWHCFPFPKDNSGKVKIEVQKGVVLEPITHQYVTSPINTPPISTSPYATHHINTSPINTSPINTSPINTPPINRRFQGKQ